MKSRHRGIFALIYVLCSGTLILQTQTTITAIREAIFLCLETVIPSLLPFIALSLLFGPMISAKNVCILGFLAGYPVGAQTVCNAFRSGSIHKKDAENMLCFVNNAGPAFIFGIAGSSFTSKFVPWMIWGIQILSALLVRVILLGIKPVNTTQRKSRLHSFKEIAVNSIQTMGCICFWVIAFRVLLRFLEGWVLFRFSPVTQTVIKGLFELTNGCVGATKVPSESLRFLVLTSMIAFGGLCITLQTLSLAGPVSCHMYFPGKILQTVLSFLMAYSIQYIFFEEKTHIPVWIISSQILLSVIFVYILKKYKIIMEKPRQISYN